MSSYGGQQNSFPFGYDPGTIGGIGLPEFLNAPPGQPTGKPLLTDYDNSYLQNFLTHFDQNDSQALDHPNHPDFQHDPHHDPAWASLPPTYVSAETSLGPRSSVDPHQIQMSGFIHGSLHAGDMAHMGTGSPFEQSLHPSTIGYGEHHYPEPPLINQLHTAPSSGPHHYGQLWQSHYPQNFVPMNGSRGPMPRFGSDASFHADGYSAPSGQAPPEMENLQDLPFQLEAQSSAGNTRPNTVPSSPNMSRKRTHDDYSEDLLPRAMNGMPNGYNMGHPQHPSPPTTTNQRRRRSIKYEQSPRSSASHTVTPTANGHHQSPDANDSDEEDAEPDADAEAESDNDTKVGHHTPSQRAFWPANKPRSSTKPPPKSKPAQKQRKSTSTSIPATTPQSAKLGSKPKPLRRSSSTATTAITNAHHTARAVLTAEQKKANHTNSEQRRRDTTQRRFCELFDLVPELEEVGKASTFKKMAAVVDKLERVQANVAELRQQYERTTGREWSWQRAAEARS